MSRDFEYDRDDLFEILEAEGIARGFVCPVCNGELSIHPVPGDRLVILACAEHGSVTRIGRITRATVSIEMERSRKRYRDVIRNLPEFWGELIPPKLSAEETIRILGF